MKSCLSDAASGLAEQYLPMFEVGKCGCVEGREGRGAILTSWYVMAVAIRN